VEHLKHGGAENGHLHQTYSQIQAGGIARKYISTTISEGESLGLIAAQHGLRKSSTESYMTKFRLTYLSAKVINPEYQGGKPYYIGATNEWKRITEEQAQAISERAARDRAAASGHKKNEKCRPQREPKWFPNGNSASSPTGTGHPESRRNLGPENPLPVPQREHPSIYWGDMADQVRLASPAEQPAAQSEDTTSSTDINQPTIRQAGRQRHHVGHDDGRDTGVWDIEEYLATKAATTAINQTSPTDRLRADLKAKLATMPKGTHARLAARVGVKSCTLSNFLSKGGSRYSPNACAEGLLREWVDGRLDLDHGRNAA
jgi:hypothetical protein